MQRQLRKRLGAKEYLLCSSTKCQCPRSYFLFRQLRCKKGSTTRFLATETFLRPLQLEVRQPEPSTRKEVSSPWYLQQFLIRRSFDVLATISSPRLNILYLRTSSLQGCPTGADAQCSFSALSWWDSTPFEVNTIHGIKATQTDQMVHLMLKAFRFSAGILRLRLHFPPCTSSLAVSGLIRWSASRMMDRPANGRQIGIFMIASFDAWNLKSGTAYNDLLASKYFTSLQGNCSFGVRGCLTLFHILWRSVWPRYICEILINLPTNQIVVTVKGAVGCWRAPFSPWSAVAV